MGNRGQRDGRARSPCHGHCHDENEDRNQEVESEQDAAYEDAMIGYPYEVVFSCY